MKIDLGKNSKMVLPITLRDAILDPGQGSYLGEDGKFKKTLETASD